MYVNTQNFNFNILVVRFIYTTLIMFSTPLPAFLLLAHECPNNQYAILPFLLTCNVVRERHFNWHVIEIEWVLKYVNLSFFFFLTTRLPRDSILASGTQEVTYSVLNCHFKYLKVWHINSCSKIFSNESRTYLGGLAWRGGFGVSSLLSYSVKRTSTKDPLDFLFPSFMVTSTTCCTAV